jgi:hypothetical protein
MYAGRQVVKAGVSFGSALAMVISWTANKSLLWAIVHGLLSWLYVIYYALRCQSGVIGCRGRGRDDEPGAAGARASPNR